MEEEKKELESEYSAIDSPSVREQALETIFGIEAQLELLKKILGYHA